MSVSQYEIPCAYDLLKLKDTVFFLSKSSLKTITIDNGEAYATFVNPSPYPYSPNRLKGFNVKLTETESLDERYKFTKQLTMSIHGHLTDSRFLMDDDYYIVVQTEDGTYYLVNVDFPSKMSFVYNLSEGQDQTDFTFVSNSNHPTLKLNWNPVTWNTCQTYQVFGIDGLKLLEKDYTTIDVEQGVINLFDGHEFKDVDYLKNTISLQENYDGKIATTTITFEIPFNNYKPSWQYNLLEFDQNLYVAHITPKNSESGIFAGYEHGLQPSYEINGNASNGESTSIKITLTEASEWGIFELDTWSYYRDSSKRWIGVDSEHICVEFGIGAYLLMQEVDGNGTPTRRYKCLEGYENRYSNYNIVGTYDEAPRFASSDCARSMARRVNSDTYYTCVDGDKYSIKFTEISYDNKKSWVRISKYELGDLVEADSSFCEIEPQYKWVISDEWDCISQFTRWIPSGTTCIDGNKYQNNLKQVSDDYIHWVNSNPLEWSASTVIEYDSDDCKSYRWVETDDIMCIETSQPQGYLALVAQTDNVSFGYYTASSNNRLQYSLDSGATWDYLLDGWATPSVNNGDKVMFKASGLSVDKERGIGKIVPSASATVEGNIMSLCYGDDFSGQTKIPNNYQFRKLFSGVTTITSAENMELPATTLKKQCYSQMFQRCTNLVTAPSVIGTSETNFGIYEGYCCSDMFNTCTSLVNAPQLPAINMGGECYWYMFQNCTSLTTAPELPGTVATYSGMFCGCSSLNYIKVLAGAWGSNTDWVKGVAESGTFIKNPNLHMSECGDRFYPCGWTVIEDIN